MEFVRRFFVLILAILAFVLPLTAYAQNAEPYADPEGRFTVPVPTNWTVESTDAYTLLRDPDELISVYIVVIESESAAAAVPEAWAIAEPDFDLEETNTITPPAPASVDEIAVVNYDMINDRLAQGFAQRVGSTVYVMLFDGDLTALTQRNAQVQQIASGLTMNAVEDTDLSEVEPLPVTEVIDDLEAYAADLLVRLEVPGAAIAIVEDGEIVYTGAVGVKTLGEDDPITVDTQFLIGSTTKPMTTTMMAALVDQGLMEWDEPVTDLLPNFAVADPELTEQFTVRNLVCACTGVPRRDFELIFNGDTLGPDDIIASLATFQFFTDFGEAFQYSNQLVSTGGYAAAAAYDDQVGLGVAYRDAMQTLVFDPIGMENTMFDFAAVEARGDFATPHGAYIDGTYKPIPLGLEESLLHALEPAGGAWSTVGDMARYMLTMIGQGVAPDGERVVSEDNLRVTWEPQVAINANTQYELGWMIGEHAGISTIDHGGNTLGMTSEFFFMPEQGIGIVVLSNGQGANLFNQGVRARLLELLYAQPFEQDALIQFVIDQGEDAQAELEASVGDAPEEGDVEAYLGDYNNAALGDVTIRYEDGRLLLDAGEFVSELLPSLTSEIDDGTAFLMAEAPLPGIGVIFRGEGDDVEMVFGESVVEYTFTREP